MAVAVAQSRAFGSGLRRMTRSLTAGWTVEFSPKRLIVTGTFFVVLVALVATESAIWRFVGTMMIVVPVAASFIVVTVKMIRRRGGGPLQAECRASCQAQAMGTRRA